MKLLALDTSSDACSVALQLGDEIHERHVIEPKEHTQILIPMIRSLLADADVALQDLDAIVLGNGPGSFIGMRIAASVAQGLAFGLNLKIVGVSSLAAVAAEAMDAHSAGDVIVAQDARMHEVYLGIFTNDGNGLPLAVGDEVLHALGRIDGLRESSLLAVGQAWQKYPEFLGLNRWAITDVLEVHYPRARYLLRLGAEGWQRGEAIEPDKVLPAYIRMKVAKIPQETGR
jgi:tRNA threonylcarbamoyladenosine biosynthesis protein TsaB